MRYGIFADVHSNIEAFEAVIRAFKKEAIDVYLCVGDIVGYGANPKECIQQVQALSAITVAGNHDWASVNLFSAEFFNPFAKEAVLWTKSRLNEEEQSYLQTLRIKFANEELAIVHGTLNHPQEFNYLSDAYAASETFQVLEKGVCFVGHTHIPGIFIQDAQEAIGFVQDEAITVLEINKYIINVGSVGQPRDGVPDAAYCIFDTEKKLVELKRAKYDIQKAGKKIIAAGLPQHLAVRLSAGT